MPQPNNIILVGFMASGKSHVGRILAQRTRMPLVDADTEIVARAGKSIDRIFAEEGEAAFRALERAVIAELCAGTGRIISAGGGAFADPDNRRAMLSGGTVFCLHAQPETIYRRLTSDNDTGKAARPLLAGDDPLGRIRELLAQRANAYSQAHHRIDTDALAPEEVAEGVVGLLQELDMVVPKWQPIQPADTASEQYDFAEIDSLRQQWLSIKEQHDSSTSQAYKSFLERLGRSWAIETGIIEGLYTLDRGVTETLIERGIAADYIERNSTNKEPDDLVRVLRDHQDSIEFVHQHIRRERPLNKQFIRELHISLTRNQNTYRAVDQFGKSFDTILDKGGFKTLPNNPTRPEGNVHEYCPPVHVESELENLVYLYGEYQQAKDVYHPLLVGAWLHHTFTQIHPFQDGNGRVVRALLTWHLVKEDFLPIVISRDDRERYIEALELADGGNLNPFIDLIVQLQKRTILQALGEPEPVAQSGLVDQVVDHIVEQIRRRDQERINQLRSVNGLAEKLRDQARIGLDEKANAISERLNEAGMSLIPMLDKGGPGDNEHWYRAEVIDTANNARNWVNLNESRFFVKLSLNNDLRNSDVSRHPRLVFVISLHHVGRELTGIMAATAFALIEHYADDNSGEMKSPGTPYFKDCTVNPFTFTWENDYEAIVPRFIEWTEEHLSVALSYWQGFLT